MKYETKWRKRLHGKAQIDIPHNDYNWKKKTKKIAETEIGCRK